MKKIFRISTVPISLNILLRGQLRYLNQFYEVTAISGAGKDLDEVREREGVKIKAIEIERQISPIKDLISLWNLYRYFKKEKPDIIHSITPKAGLLSVIAGKLAGVPIRMHTFTGLIFPHKEGHFQKLLIWMDRLLCRFATHIYPEGNGVKQDLLEQHITNKPLKIIANGNVNGIDLDYFSHEKIDEDEKNSLKKKIGITEDDFVFVFVGRLVKDKGINELVAAFSAISNQKSPKRNEQSKFEDYITDSEFYNKENAQTLKASKPQTFKLLLVGSFEQNLDPLYPETIRAINENPNIITVGFQQDIRPYLAISDALVFPSYREGFPNVVLQALAMELPVIVTGINGCNEIVKEEENGLLVEVRNSANLADSMERLLKDKMLYNHLQRNLRTSVAPYRQDLVWEGVLLEYQSALKG